MTIEVGKEVKQSSLSEEYAEQGGFWNDSWRPGKSTVRVTATGNPDSCAFHLEGLPEQERLSCHPEAGTSESLLQFLRLTQKILKVFCWERLGFTSDFPFYIWIPYRYGLRPRSVVPNPGSNRELFVFSNQAHTGWTEKMQLGPNSLQFFLSVHVLSSDLFTQFICFDSGYWQKIVVVRPTVPVTSGIKYATVIPVLHETNI